MIFTYIWYNIINTYKTLYIGTCVIIDEHIWYIYTNERIQTKHLGIVTASDLHN